MVKLDEIPELIDYSQFYLEHLKNFVRATNTYMHEHEGACPFCGPGEYPDPPDEDHVVGCPMAAFQNMSGMSYEDAIAAMPPVIGSINSPSPMVRNE